MRFAKTVTALALACSLALAIPTFAAPAAEEQAGRQEDLELLYQTIRDRHPGPFTNTPEQEFLARSWIMTSPEAAPLPASLRSRPG